MRARIFYGWWIVAAAFTVCFVGFGNAYTFSTFLGALETQFAASRGSVSLVFSIAGFLYFGLGVISGPLADRFGARPVTLAGMAMVGLGMIAASFAHTLWQVYAGYGLGIGLGVGTAYAPALGAVQRWFTRHRGLASGIAVSGIGVGTLVMPPLAAVLIHHVGWRAAYLILGLAALLLGMSMCLLFEDDPAQRRLAPDGEPLAADAASLPRTGHSVAAALKSRAFITVYVACLIASFGLFVPFVHLVPFAIDHQVSVAGAAWLLGLVGAGSTVGRFFLGGLADQVGRVNALMLMFIGMGIAMLVWCYSASFWALAGFAVAYGFFQGGFVAIVPALVMDLFGGRNISAIMGALFTSVAVGTLVGPTLAGFAYDASHSYTLPILGGVATNFVAARILAGLAKAQRRARQSQGL